MQIIRGTVESYDAVNHQVDVRPQRHPGALIAGASVGRDIPAELVQPDQVVALCEWPDVGAVVLAPLGGGIAWPTVASAIESGNTTVASTSAGQDVAHPNVSVSITTLTTSRFLIWQMTNWRAGSTLRAPLGYAQVLMDTTLLGPIALLGYAQANKWYPLPLMFRTASSYAAGTYVFKPSYHFYSVDSTTTTATTLTVMALPV